MSAPSFPQAPHCPVPLQALLDAFPALRVPLELLGVDVDDDLPRIWRDRYAHDRPVSSATLEQLMDTLGSVIAAAYAADTT